MRSVILVGGLGTRMRPLTYETPKQMLPLVGVAMIERVLSRLHGYGVTDAVLALGYLPDQFIRAYPDNVIAGVRVTYAVEPEPLDTAGAIRFAARAASIDETFLVVNGDVVSNLDVSKLVAFHHERGALATLALHPVNDPSRYGVVPTDAEGRVVAFVEKPPRDEAPTNLINAGTYVMEPAVLDRIAPDVRVSVERTVFPALAEAGRLFALADVAYWIDAGTPRSYLRVNADLLVGRAGPPLARSRTDSWVHPQAAVEPDAALERAVVDRDCYVGAGAILIDVVMLPGAVVEQGAVVRSSILGPEAVVGGYSTLGELCVVGANQHVAPGSVLAGDVRLGGV